jgi:hypothetical protein
MSISETPLLDALIEELQTFCKARRGRVAELAEHLGVKQPQLSAWLTKKRQPGGEATLQLQRWLAEEREAESRKNAAQEIMLHSMVQSLRKEKSATE